MPQIVTIDIETYYSREFSLSKITTEEYVRSPEFEVIGLSLKIDDAPAQWYPKPQVAEVLKSIDWSSKFVVCQNTAFDAAILHWHYGVQPKAWLDTLGMSRALFPHAQSHSLAAQAARADIGAKGDEVIHALGLRYADFGTEALERYGEYCKNDTELTYSLFCKYMGMGFPRQELELIDLTLRMFVEPVLVLDKAALQTHLKDVVDRKEALLDRVRDMMLAGGDPDYVHAVYTEGIDGIKKLLMSNDKFADLLRRFNVEPPMKRSPTTGKMTYAFAKTDEDFKALEEHSDPDVQGLVAARLGNKTTLEETRTQRFIGMAERGAFPVPLRYYGAHSGRWSGQDSVNLQNLPARGPSAGRIKRAIMAPPGHVVIDCDSSQIEARTLAWLAGQHDLVQAFADKQDVYKIMASSIYDVPVDQIDPGQRQVGKTVILGAGYGVGHKKLRAFLKMQAKVDVSEEEAKRIVDKYRATYPKIPELWRQGEAALRALAMGNAMRVDVPGVVNVVPDEGLTLPSGLFIRYPDLKRVLMKNAEGEEKNQWRYISKCLPVYIYGGKCLAADTEVLTERGWIQIASVTVQDRVWDGVEWVNHSGLTYQGEKITIVLNGVRMTPDHNVLTTEGWQSASSCEGLHGADFWMPDGSEVCGSRETFSLGVPVPVRDIGNAHRDRCGEVRQAGREPVLRMCRRAEVEIARTFGPSSILGVEVYEGSMSATFASGVAQLRRAWDKGVYAVGAIVRGILGRHGAFVSAGVDVGSNRQLRGLHTGELPLGVVQNTSGESARSATDRHGESAVHNGGAAIHSSIPMAPEPVYDLLNAGPRTRFVVRGSEGPFLVHNCVENFTQAVARCVVAEQMLRIAKRYKVVLTVHDAVAIIAKESDAKEARAYVEECMSWNPKWAAGLPLACESGVGYSYGEC